MHQVDEIHFQRPRTGPQVCGCEAGPLTANRRSIVSHHSHFVSLRNLTTKPLYLGLINFSFWHWTGKSALNLDSLFSSSAHTNFLSLRFLLAWLVMAYYSVKAKKSVLSLAMSDVQHTTYNRDVQDIMSHPAACQMVG